MQSTVSPEDQNERKKAIRYFIVGYVFLLAMALFWSVDDGIVYMLFGVAIFFIFLGFYSWPKRHLSEQPFRTSQKERTTRTDENLFKNIFKQHVRTTSHAPKPAASPEANRRIALLVVFAVFAIFILFFIGIIFTSGDEWDESDMYFQTAQGQYWDGDYDSAYINYRKAWKLDENNLEALVGYGNVLAVRDQVDSAMIIYDRALSIQPDYKEAAYYKASTLNNQQKYNDAISVLLPVLEKYPDYYDAMLVVGDAYYLQQKYDEAIIWYGNAYENGQVRSQALSHIMAYIFDTKGDYARAIDLYKEALSYDSSVADIHKRLGELLPGEDGSFYREQAIKLQQP